MGHAMCRSGWHKNEALRKWQQPSIGMEHHRSPHYSYMFSMVASMSCLSSTEHNMYATWWMPRPMVGGQGVCAKAPSEHSCKCIRITDIIAKAYCLSRFSAQDWVPAPG